MSKEKQKMLRVFSTTWAQIKQLAGKQQISQVEAIARAVQRDYDLHFPSAQPPQKARRERGDR